MNMLSDEINPSVSMLIDQSYELNQDIMCKELENEWILVDQMFKLENIEPFTQWVDDALVTCCYMCKVLFSIFRRKHHCRLCGKIFCYKCSNNKIEIPRKLSKNNYCTPVRVCDSCYRLIQCYKDITLVLCMFAYLDIKSLVTCMMVCRKWHTGGLYYFLSLKKLHCKLSCESLTDLDKNFLENNRYFIGGHSKLILQYFHLFPHSVDVNLFVEKQKHPFNCKLFKCNISCNEKLTCEECIQLLFCIKNDTVCKHILSYLHNNITDFEFKCFIPLFISLIRKGNVNVINFIFNRSSKSINLFGRVYWELLRSESMSEENRKKIKNNINSGIVMDDVKKNWISDSDPNFTSKETKIREEFEQLLENVKYSSINQNELFCEMSDIKEKLKNIQKTFSVTNNFYKYSLSTIKDMLSLVDSFYFPTLDGKFVAVDVDAITQKKSNSLPLVIPFKMITNKQLTIQNILYKNENITKDYIISKIIQISIFYLKKEKHIETDLVFYEILPINQKSGLIEIIQDSYTIDQIQQSKRDLINFVLDNNPKDSIEIIRKRCLESLSFYTVICYLLGIGDRHLDNIMIHKKGYIFHIDYAYILGDDPKISSMTVRLSDNILDLIGGKNSPNYYNFKQKCSLIFTCLQKYIPLIITYFDVLVEDGIVDKQKILLEIQKRAELNEKYLNVQEHLNNVIDQSSQSFTHYIIDLTHKFAKMFKPS